jgi:peptidyl-prolyl isomerase E (cyclophilin E)
MTTNPKAVLYVGGLADRVDEHALRAAFVPFGEVLSVHMPRDVASKKHRGFGFVEFEDVVRNT